MPPPRQASDGDPTTRTGQALQHVGSPPSLLAHVLAAECLHDRLLVPHAGTSIWTCVTCDCDCLSLQHHLEGAAMTRTLWGCAQLADGRDRGMCDLKPRTPSLLEQNAFPHRSLVLPRYLGRPGVTVCTATIGSACSDKGHGGRR